MKVLALLVCVFGLSIAAPSHINVHDEHVPIIGSNGVPLNTPEVQQATAEHLAFKAEAKARNGDKDCTDKDSSGTLEQFVNKAQHKVGIHGFHGDFHKTQTVPLVHHHNMQPVHHFGHKISHTPAAPIGHQVQHHVVSSVNHLGGSTEHQIGSQIHQVLTHALGNAINIHPVYETSHGVPVINEAGVPVETPEVLAAKNVHFAAHEAALARIAHEDAIQVQTDLTSGKPIHTISSGHVTVPHHVTSALHQVLTGNSVSHGVHNHAYGTIGSIPVNHQLPVYQQTPVNHHVSQQVKQIASHHVVPGPHYQIPVISDHKVPHVGVHPEAYKTTGGFASVNDQGHPLETPEVQAAKDVHFTAHAAALAHLKEIESQNPSEPGVNNHDDLAGTDCE